MCEILTKVLFLILFACVKSSVIQGNHVHLRQYWKLILMEHTRPNRNKHLTDTNITWERYTIKHVEGHLRNLKNKTLNDMFNLMILLRKVKHSISFNYQSCARSRVAKRFILTSICPGTNGIISRSFTVFKLQPHRYLWMNLTLIEFKLTGALQCLTGNEGIALEAMNILSYHHGNITQKWRDGECGEKYLANRSTEHQCELDTLCGHYPPHTRLLLYPYTYIEIKHNPVLKSKLTLLFQVISSDFADRFSITCMWIRCAQTQPLYPYTETILNIVLTRFHTCQLISFRLVTIRINTLIVKMKTKENTMVFDGPFYESSTLTAAAIGVTDKSFYTSSFQCTLLLILKTKGSKIQIERLYDYKSVKINSFASKTLNNVMAMPISLSFPWSSCIQTHLILCALNIKVPAPFAINITIPAIVYMGPSLLVDNCKFGGLVILFKNSDTDSLKEMLLECDDMVFDTEEHVVLPPIFSEVNTEEIWISTVSYSPYSKMNCEIMIVSSPCKGIQPELQMITNNDCRYPGDILVGRPSVGYFQNPRGFSDVSLHTHGTFKLRIFIISNIVTISISFYHNEYIM